MNTINDGPMAFPVWELNGSGQPEMTEFGMYLRDYFAAKAMQAQVNNPLKLGSDEAHRLIAKMAYRMADAMLKARENCND